MMHPDVIRALSVVIDVDDVGEEGMRRQKIEDVLFKLKQENLCAFQFVYKFSVEEQGWGIQFALNVDSNGCFLRLADKHDYEDGSGSSRSVREKRRQWLDEKRAQNLAVQLPPVSKLTADDLLIGVGTFLCWDVMAG